MTKKIIIFFIKGYHHLSRAFWSMLPGQLIEPMCRFQPSCSEYAVDAVQKYGVLKGMGKALVRVFRCHPFTQGNIFDEA